LLKASAEDIKDAKNFFALSGEEGEKLKGKPQELILFTSKEVISGEKKFWDKINIKDLWFGTNKLQNPPKTLSRYLSNLFKELMKNDNLDLFREGKLNRFLLVKVDHTDFKDCFYKVGITLNALRDKEIWINLIGGTNQINISELTTGTFFAVVTRYYYIFQSQTDLLHPDLEKKYINELKSFTPIFFEKWQELPFYNLEMGKIITKLIDLFQYNEKINISQVQTILEEMHYSKKFISKLRGRLINIEGNAVSKTHYLNALSDMINEIRKQKINNKSAWLNWARKNEILYEFEIK